MFRSPGVIDALDVIDRKVVMNILDAIVGAQDGEAVGALANQFGLSQDQTVGALGALLPALAGGLQRNVSSPAGLDRLSAALEGPTLLRPYSDPTPTPV